MTWHSHVCRNPKFSDDFERDRANDLPYHLSRHEPSRWPLLLERLWRRVVGMVRSKRFARARVDKQCAPSGYALLTTLRRRDTDKP